MVALLTRCYGGVQCSSSTGTGNGTPCLLLLWLLLGSSYLGVHVASEWCMCGALTCCRTLLAVVGICLIWHDIVDKVQRVRH